METLNYNNITYIHSDYILENAPIYSKGSRGARNLIKNKDIKEDNFIYAKKQENEWVICNGKSTKFDKVFFKYDIIEQIPELNNKDIITDDNGIEKAPKIIYLTDNEKFQDNEGNVLEIETRGERNVNNCFFKVKDVSKAFDILYLNDSLLDKNGNYQYLVDYKYFICEKKINSRNKTTKKTNYKTTTKKELFLTYEGMTRVLYLSRNNKTKKFVSWAKTTLFTAQMGTTEQKNKLVSQIKGVSYESIQELFSINAREMPCVYLTAFNTVSILRDTMNIDNSYTDDSIVYKFGLTKSFEQRKNGHKSEYKSIDKLIDKKLVYFTYIDPLYISEAETEIKNMLNDYKISWELHDELVVIPNNMLKFVKTIYENIGMKYSGHTSEFNKKINELKLEITQLQNKEANFVKDLDIQKELYEHKLVIKDHQIEILQLKLQLTQK